MNNSMSSNHLNDNIQVKFSREKNKGFTNTLTESRNLLNEYRENLMKFDNNINEIKDALNLLKLSIINYKVFFIFDLFLIL